MDDSTHEHWKVIPSTGGRYSASNLGRIRRNVGPQCRKTRIVNPTRKNRAKLVIEVKHQPKRLQVAVHNLVAEAWLGPCPDGLEVNHKDRNRHNNRVENLEYISHTENMRHAMLVGENRRRKLDQHAVRQIRRMRAAGMHVDDIRSRFGVTRTCVYCVLSGKTWSYVN